MFRRLQGLARSPEELPGESGRAKPSSLQKSQKSASGEGRGPKKYCKTYDICNMDLKNRAHSHVLAPDTKSTAPKHGSVGIFQKLGARGGKFPGASTIFRSKKVGPPCTSAIVNKRFGIHPRHPPHPRFPRKRGHGVAVRTRLLAQRSQDDGSC